MVLPFIWAGAALLTAGSLLIESVKPEQTGFHIPIFGWIAIVLFLLIIFRSR